MPHTACFPIARFTQPLDLHPPITIFAIPSIPCTPPPMLLRCSSFLRRRWWVSLEAMRRMQAPTLGCGLLASPTF